MISLEAYRSSIGRYYCKAVSLSQIIHLYSCNCQKYERCFAESTRYDINKMIKLGFYDEINYLDMSDYCSSFTDNCRDLRFCITAVESMYDVSFLRIIELIACGDVEVNPGPATNNVETPKGRGRPKKGSKKLNFMKPKKLDFSPDIDDHKFQTQVEQTAVIIDSFVDHTVVTNDIFNSNNEPSTSSTAQNDMTDMRSLSINENMNDNVTVSILNRNFPVKLMNEGVNVCFFNSICQVLYSLPSFLTYLEHLNPELIDDPTVVNRICDRPGE